MDLATKSILSGSIAGMTSCALFHPLDVLRTKIQSMSPRRRIAASNGGCPTSPATVFRETVRHGGYRSLYTGLSLPLGAQAVYKATVFTVNNVSRSALAEWKRKHPSSSSDGKLSSLETFLCGSLGGFLNGLLFVTPVEYVRNQLISQHSRLAAAAASGSTGTTSSVPTEIMTGPVDVIRRTLRASDGSPTGLWRGAGVTVLRDSLGCGCFFLVFETARTLFAKALPPPPNDDGNVDGTRRFLVTAAAGAAAGLGFWSVALPLDSVKTLVQTGRIPSAMSLFANGTDVNGGGGKVRGGFPLRSLFRGWQVAFGRGAPAAAVSLGTYDLLFKSLSEI